MNNLNKILIITLFSFCSLLSQNRTIENEKLEYSSKIFESIDTSNSNILSASEIFKKTVLDGSKYGLIAGFLLFTAGDEPSLEIFTLFTSVSLSISYISTLIYYLSKKTKYRNLILAIKKINNLDKSILNMAKNLENTETFYDKIETEYSKSSFTFYTAFQDFRTNLRSCYFAYAVFKKIFTEYRTNKKDKLEYIEWFKKLDTYIENLENSILILKKHPNFKNDRKAYFNHSDVVVAPMPVYVNR